MELQLEAEGLTEPAKPHHKTEFVIPYQKKGGDSYRDQRGLKTVIVAINVNTACTGKYYLFRL